MQRQEIKSSTIKTAGWEESTETLEIEFNSGGIYQYAGVPRSVWLGFLNPKSYDGSHGKFFMAEIRGKYQYVCMNPKQKEEKKHGQSQNPTETPPKSKGKARTTQGRPQGKTLKA